MRSGTFISVGSLVQLLAAFAAVPLPGGSLFKDAAAFFAPFKVGVGVFVLHVLEPGFGLRAGLAPQVVTRAAVVHFGDASFMGLPCIF